MRVNLILVFFAALVTGSASAQESSGYAPVNGIRMYYEVHGKGSMPLILIHGGGSTIGTSFGHLLPLLARDRWVIAVETQGHGRTNDREGPETFQQDADDVAALVRYLSFFENMPKATIDVMPLVLREAFLTRTPDSAKLMTMFRKDKQRMIDFPDWPDDDLRSIKAPAMIISSDRDVIVPEHSVRMARLIPGARLLILPGVHGAPIGALEAGVGKGDADIVARLVEEFLAGK